MEINFLCALGHFAPGKRARVMYPLDRRLGVPQSQFGGDSKKKNLHSY